MDFDRKNFRLYAITDRAWEGEKTLEEQVEAALRGGVTMLQLREKAKESMGDEYREEALRIQTLCRRYNVPFIINDDVMLALDIDADGVHLGQDDMPPRKARVLLGDDKIIGVTVKTVEQAKAAEEAGADYMGSGAVFGSSTKLDTSTLDHDMLDRIADSCNIPVVAIGGISGDNMPVLKGRHIEGVAVVSAIFGESDCEAAAAELRALSDDMFG